MCAGNPRRVSCTIGITRFSELFEVLKIYSSLPKILFDRLAPPKAAFFRLGASHLPESAKAAPPRFTRNSPFLRHRGKNIQEASQGVKICFVKWGETV